MELKNKILLNKGSVQGIEEIPLKIRDLYKTTWEIKQRIIIDMAAQRGPYIDQSQSLNIHMMDANLAKVTSMHFHGWRSGLKTGMYYLRTKAAADAIQFTVDADEKEDETISGLAERAEGSEDQALDPDSLEATACSLESPDDCLMCGS